MFICFVSFVFSIVALSAGKSNDEEKFVISVYIVLEGVTKLIIIVIILLLAVSPIICISLVFYVKCCKQNAVEI